MNLEGTKVSSEKPNMDPRSSQGGLEGSKLELQEGKVEAKDTLQKRRVSETTWGRVFDAKRAPKREPKGAPKG